MNFIEVEIPLKYCAVRRSTIRRLESAALALRTRITVVFVCGDDGRLCLDVLK
jgi:hypothetical protein